MVTIVGMAVVTYATRASGLWLGNRFGIPPWLDDALAAVPGTILVSLVAPAIVAAGIPGIVAAVATVSVAIALRGNVILPMIVGVLVAAALRLL